MNISALAGARRGRWAISFADLLLLLLGFFVMLQASGQRRDAMLAQVRQQFGGQASSPMEIRAAELFLPGEALLTDQGRARLKIVAEDWDSYQRFLTTKLTSAPNVSHVKSALAIRTSKSTPGVPIDTEIGDLPDEDELEDEE